MVAEDEVMLKELREISHKTGFKQQELIAEGLNYVLDQIPKARLAVRWRSATISCGTFVSDKSLISLVGAAGFKPAAPCSQNERISKKFKGHSDSWHPDHATESQWLR
jgi:hypothetical protein